MGSDGRGGGLRSAVGASRTSWEPLSYSPSASLVVTCGQCDAEVLQADLIGTTRSWVSVQAPKQAMVIGLVIAVGDLARVVAFQDSGGAPQGVDRQQRILHKYYTVAPGHHPPRQKTL